MDWSWNGSLCFFVTKSVEGNWIFNLPCSKIETMIIDIRYGAPLLYLQKIVACGFINVGRLGFLCELANDHCNGMKLTNDEFNLLNLIQTQRSEQAIKIAKMLKI